jgi:hypothetical protein
MTLELLSDYSNDKNMDSCDIRTRAYKNGKTFDQCKEIAETMTAELKGVIEKKWSSSLG